MGILVNLSLPPTLSSHLHPVDIHNLSGSLVHLAFKTLFVGEHVPSTSLYRLIHTHMQKVI